MMEASPALAENSGEDARTQTLLAVARAARPIIGKERPPERPASAEVSSLVARKRAEKAKEGEGGPTLQPVWDNDLYIGLKEGPLDAADGRAGARVQSRGSFVPSSLLPEHSGATGSEIKRILDRAYIPARSILFASVLNTDSNRDASPPVDPSLSLSENTEQATQTEDLSWWSSKKSQGVWAMLAERENRVEELERALSRRSDSEHRSYSQLHCEVAALRLENAELVHNLHELRANQHGAAKEHKETHDGLNSEHGDLQLSAQFSSHVKACTSIDQLLDMGSLNWRERMLLHRAQEIQRVTVHESEAASASGRLQQAGAIAQLSAKVAELERKLAEQRAELEAQCETVRQAGKLGIERVMETAQLDSAKLSAQSAEAIGRLQRCAAMKIEQAALQQANLVAELEAERFKTHVSKTIFDSELKSAHAVGRIEKQRFTNSMERGHLRISQVLQEQRQRAEHRLMQSKINLQRKALGEAEALRSRLHHVVALSTQQPTPIREEERLLVAAALRADDFEHLCRGHRKLRPHGRTAVAGPDAQTRWPVPGIGDRSALEIESIMACVETADVSGDPDRPSIIDQTALDSFEPRHGVALLAAIGCPVNPSCELQDSTASPRTQVERWMPSEQTLLLRCWTRVERWLLVCKNHFDVARHEFPSELREHISLVLGTFVDLLCLGAHLPSFLTADFWLVPMENAQAELEEISRDIVEDLFQGLVEPQTTQLQPFQVMLREWEAAAQQGGHPLAADLELVNSRVAERKGSVRKAGTPRDQLAAVDRPILRRDEAPTMDAAANQLRRRFHSAKSFSGKRNGEHSRK